MRTTLLTTKSLVRFSSLAVLGASFAVHPFASRAQQKSSNPSQAFEQQVIDVIMRHPDVLIRSVELYQERQKQERSQKAQNLARHCRMMLHATYLAPLFSEVALQRHTSMSLPIFSVLFVHRLVAS